MLMALRYISGGLRRACRGPCDRFPYGSPFPSRSVGLGFAPDEAQRTRGERARLTRPRGFQRARRVALRPGTPRVERPPAGAKPKPSRGEALPLAARGPEADARK